MCSRNLCTALMYPTDCNSYIFAGPFQRLLEPSLHCRRRHPRCCRLSDRIALLCSSYFLPLSQVQERGGSCHARCGFFKGMMFSSRGANAETPFPTSHTTFATLQMVLYSNCTPSHRAQELKENCCSNIAIGNSFSNKGTCNKFFQFYTYC